MKNTKKDTLDELYLTFGLNYFDTDAVKDISKKHNFKNHFDVAKLDSKEQLSPLMIKNDVFLLKVGNGKYRFSKGIEHYYHKLEKITESITMNYIEDDIIGDITSEGDLLKYVELNGILSDFLNCDVKSYGSGRRSTKELNYFINGEEIILDESVQIEIDETYFTGKLLLPSEAKNKHLKTFNVSQLFFPYLYFSTIKNLKSRMDIKCIFIQNKLNKRLSQYEVQIYQYEFKKELDITSISLVKNKEYILKF